MTSKAAVIVGVGPGVGGALAEQLAATGYAVGLLGLEQVVLDEIVGKLDVPAYTAVADASDMDAVRAAVSSLAEQLGRVDLLHFNPSAWRESSPLVLTPAELAEDVTFGVGGLLVALQAAHPRMSNGARVTATGSMAADKPGAVATTLGVQKAGLRNLVHSIDATLKDEGIRAVSVTVQGALRSSETFSSENVAKAIVQAARQDETQWRSEVTYP